MIPINNDQTRQNYSFRFEHKTSFQIDVININYTILKDEKENVRNFI